MASEQAQLEKKKKKKKKGQEAVFLVKRAACAQLREGHIPNI